MSTTARLSRLAVRRVLSGWDAACAAVRRYADEISCTGPGVQETPPTVPEYIQERLAVAEQRAHDTARMLAFLEADIAATRAATEAIRAEREQLAAEHDAERRAAVQRGWLLRRLAGELVS